MDSKKLMLEMSEFRRSLLFMSLVFMDFSASLRFGLVSASSDNLFFFLFLLREKVDSILDVDVTLGNRFFAFSFDRRV